MNLGATNILSRTATSRTKFGNITHHLDGSVEKRSTNNISSLLGSTDTKPKVSKPSLESVLKATASLKHLHKPKGVPSLPGSALKGNKSQFISPRLSSTSSSLAKSKGISKISNQLSPDGQALGKDDISCKVKSSPQVSPRYVTGLLHQKSRIVSELLSPMSKSKY